MGAIHGAQRSRQPTRTGTWMQTSQSLRSSKAALRANSQAGSPPHSTPTHTTTHPTKHPTNTSAATRHDESKRKQSQPLIFVAYRHSTEALAWVGLRGPPAHGCAGGAYRGEGALLARHRLACVRTHSRQRLGRAAERDLQRAPRAHPCQRPPRCRHTEFDLALALASAFASRKNKPPPTTKKATPFPESLFRLLHLHCRFSVVAGAGFEPATFGL